MACRRARRLQRTRARMRDPRRRSRRVCHRRVRLVGDVRVVGPPIAGRSRAAARSQRRETSGRRHRGAAVDTTTGVAVLPGVPGELQFRGPSVLSGYLTGTGANPPERTDDGWFATGDLGTVEPDGGFVYLTRLGDALRLSGFLTDPAEIEQRLLAHECVTGAQVVGVPSITGGEVAVAFVTVTGPTGANELIAHCREALADYKVPARRCHRRASYRRGRERREGPQDGASRAGGRSRSDELIRFPRRSCLMRSEKRPMESRGTFLARNAAVDPQLTYRARVAARVRFAGGAGAAPVELSVPPSATAARCSASSSAVNREFVSVSVKTASVLFCAL